MKIYYKNFAGNTFEFTFNRDQWKSIQDYLSDTKIDLMYYEKEVSSILTLACSQGAIYPWNALLDIARENAIDNFDYSLHYYDGRKTI